MTLVEKCNFVIDMNNNKMLNIESWKKTSITKFTTSNLSTHLYSSIYTLI